MVDTSRMTDRSRKVVQIAEKQAHLRGANAVFPEHVLLALALEGNGIAAHVLQDFGATKETLACLLPPEIPSNAGSKVSLDWSEESLLAIHQAYEEVKLLNHHYIGTEHLILGIARTCGGAVLEILRSLNIAPEFLIKSVYSLLGHDDLPTHR